MQEKKAALGKKVLEKKALQTPVKKPVQTPGKKPVQTTGKKPVQVQAKKPVQEKKIHPSAIVDSGAVIGEGTTVWAFVQVGANAIVGKNCILGNGCYIDRNAKIGDNVKVMNKAQVFRGCEIGDNVFIGPGCVIANDKKPKHDTERKFQGYEWKIGNNVSIGANSVILPDINIGNFALIGACSVVTKNVPAHGLVYGNPAKLHGFICKCGEKMRLKARSQMTIVLQCTKCQEGLEVPPTIFNKIE